MSSYINRFMSVESYGYFWEKYRPAILKLMISSLEGPQQYKLSAHEVKTANPKDKGRVTFKLTVHKSKAINDVRSSPIAKDLLRVLQQSGKASELSGSSTYEFELDKHFILHVSKMEIQHDTMDQPQSVITEQIEG